MCVSALSYFNLNQVVFPFRSHGKIPIQLIKLSDEAASKVLASPVAADRKVTASASWSPIIASGRERFQT